MGISLPLQFILKFVNPKGGFKSEGRGGFSQLPKMSAEKKLSWDLENENENSDSFLCLQV